MSRVTKYDICSANKESKKDTRMYLWLSDKGKDHRERIRIICIDVNDAIKMTDDRAAYELEEQTQIITPKYIKDFDKYISDFMRTVYEATELISSEEYIEFCLKRLAIYQAVYYDRRYICEKFYERYMPGSVKEKYGSAAGMAVRKMFAENTETIQAEIQPYYEKRGGGFFGCYVDDWGRKRPLTERIYWVERYNYVDELKICIRKELSA